MWRFRAGHLAVMLAGGSQAASPPADASPEHLKSHDASCATGVRIGEGECTAPPAGGRCRWAPSLISPWQKANLLPTRATFAGSGTVEDQYRALTRWFLAFCQVISRRVEHLREGPSISAVMSQLSAQQQPAEKKRARERLRRDHHRPCLPGAAIRTREPPARCHAKTR